MYIGGEYWENSSKNGEILDFFGRNCLVWRRIPPIPPWVRQSSYKSNVKSYFGEVCNSYVARNENFSQEKKIRAVEFLRKSWLFRMMKNMDFYRPMADLYSSLLESIVAFIRPNTFEIMKQEILSRTYTGESSGDARRISTFSKFLSWSNSIGILHGCIWASFWVSDLRRKGNALSKSLAVTSFISRPNKNKTKTKKLYIK